MTMESLDPNKKRWYKEYLSALKDSLPGLDCGDGPFEFSTLTCIAESLILRLEFVADFFESSTPTRHSEDKLQNFELYLLYETNKQVGELSHWDWLSVQKLVSCTIFAFKCTVNELILPKHEKSFKNGFDIKMMEMCSNFLLYSCKSLAVFSVATNQSQNYINFKGDQTAKFLAETFIGSQFQFSHSFSNNLSSLLECLKKNVWIMVFIKELLTNKATSPTALAILLNHFSKIKTLATFGQNFVEDNDLSLLASSLQSFFFMRGIDVTHKRSIEEIIRNCIELIPRADNPFGLLCVLHSIFSMLTNKSMNPMVIHLCHTIPFLLNKFEVWLLTPLERRTWCMLLKTVITVFNSILLTPGLLLSRIKIFITALIFSLKENVELSVLGLRCFKNVAAAVDFSTINSCDFEKDLLNALQDALRNPAKSEEILRNPIIEFKQFPGAENLQYSTEEVERLVFTILGTMGGFNRNNFKEPPKLHQADDMDKCLVIRFYDNSSYIRFPLGKIMDEALENLLNPRVHIEIKKDSYELVKKFLECHIQSLKKSFSLKFMFGSPYEAIPYGLADVCSENPVFRVCKTAFIAMFVAQKIPVFSCQPFGKRVIGALVKNKRDLELQLLIDAAIHVICLPANNFSKVSITPLENILDMAVEKFGNDTVNFPFFKYLSEKVTNLCYESTWEAKVAGCKAIELLLRKFQDWILGNLNDLILEPLIYCIAGIKEQISFGSNNIEKLGRKILLKCFDELYLNEEAWKQSHSHVLKTLIKRTVSPNFFVREQVRYIWQHLFRNFKEKLKKITFPVEILSESYSLLYLHEDFDFCKILQSLFAPLFTDDGDKKQFYDVCISFCVFEVRPGDSFQDRLRSVRLCCYALHTLLFNFVSSENIGELFQVFFGALKSSVDDISKAGERCLKHISEEENSRQLVQPEMINKWFVESLNLYSGQKLKDFNFKKLIVLLKYFFPSLESIDLARECLKEYFTKWKEQMIGQMKEVRKHNTLLLAVKLKEGPQIITLLKLVSGTEPCNLDSVITLVFELQKHMKQVLLAPLRDPILSFSKKFPLKTLNCIIKIMKSETYGSELYSSFLEELVKTEDSPFHLLLNENDMLRANYKYILRILHFITIYKAQWFENKHKLADFFINKYAEKLEVSDSKLDHNSIKEVIVIAKCLLCYYKYHKDKFDILFILVKIFHFQFAYHLQFLKISTFNLDRNLPLNLKKKFCEECISKFDCLFLDKKDCVAEVLNFIFIPLFGRLLRNGNGWELFNEHFAKEYYNSLEKLESQETSHSEKVRLAFLKLTIIMTLNLDQQHNNSIFKQKSKEFAKCCQNYKYSSLYGYLLRLLLNLEEKCYEEEDLKAALSELLKAYTEEKFLVQYAFSIAASRIPIKAFSNCIEYLITDDKNEGNIFSIIADNPKEYHHVRHVFLTPMLKAIVQELTLLKPIKKKTVEEDLSVQKITEVDMMELDSDSSFNESTHSKILESALQESYIRTDVEKGKLVNQEATAASLEVSEVFFLQSSEFFKRRSAAYDMISIIIQWTNNDRKFINSENMNTIVNGLFQITFLVNFNLFEESQQPISKMLLFILEDIAVKKLFTLDNLQFSDWLQVFFLLIPEASAKPKIKRLVMETLKLMVKIVSYMPMSAVESFLKHMEIHFESLSKLNLLEILCNFFPILLKRIQPDDFRSKFGKLYDRIESICSERDLHGLDLTFKSRATLLMKYLPLIKSHMEIVNAVQFCNELAVVNKTYVENKRKDDEMSVKVGLKVIKEIFFQLEFSQLSSLGLPELIEKLQNPELMLLIIDILNLYIRCLEEQYREPCAALKEDFDLLFVLCEKISSRIELDFSDHKKLSINFFKIAMKKLGASRRLQFWFKDEVMHIFYMAGVLPENQKMFCKIIAKEFNHDIVRCFNYLCKVCLKVAPSHSPVKLFITLTLMTVQSLSIYFNSASDVSVRDTSLFLASLMGLCDANDSLAGYVWMNLFASIWGILKDREKKHFYNKLERIVQRLSNVKYSPIPNLHDVFIKATLKCNLDFILHIDSKYIHRSYDFQLFLSALLEKPLSLHQSSPQEIHKYIDVLNRVYAHLEGEAFYSFNQVYGNHGPKTLQALSFFQDDQFSEAYNLYALIIKKDYPGEDWAEKQFCERQLNKCTHELNRWQFCSSEANLQLRLQDVKILSKWIYEKKDDKQSNSIESLTLRCYACDFNRRETTFQLNEESEENIYRLINLCSKVWQSLPPVLLSRQQYSLLQLIQQLTELLEAWNISRMNKYHTVQNPCKELNATATAWDQRPCLLSDEFYYLTEIFHIRQVAFRELNNSSCSDSLHSYLSAAATHGINDCAIDLCSIAFLFRNRYMRNLRLDECSLRNIFKWNQLQLMHLLEEVSLHTPAISDTAKKMEDFQEDCLIKTLNFVNPTLMKYMHSDDKHILRSLQLRILKELKLEQSCTSYVFDNPDCSTAWDILSEFYLNLYYESSDITRVVMSMRCLIEACKFGSDATSLKLVTKVIYLLELENENFSIASELIKYYSGIPRTYWIPFLPNLISHLGNKKESANLCRALTHILIHVGEVYPQQVFLALQCLSNIDSPVNAKGVQAWSKEILMALEQAHPNLVSILQKIVEMFHHFRSNLNQFCLYKCKEKLETTYTLLFQNFKTKQKVFDAKKIQKSILNYLEKAFECDFRLLKNLKFEDGDYKKILDYPASFNRLKYGTPENVIVSLKDDINRFSKDKIELQSLDVREKMRLLSSLYRDSSMNIMLFGQNPLIDTSHQITIYKFLPKVDVVKWEDGFAWKIYLKGNNGKEYSFLLLEDFCRHETLNTMKLVNFWEFLNPLINKHVHCERRFLKAFFPRTVPISSCKLVPHDDELFFYQDIYKTHIRILKDLQNIGTKYLELFENEIPTFEKLKQQFELIQKEVRKDIFSNYIEKLYPSSTLDLYCFKKQFVKNLSMLVSAEMFFKISCRKQLCVMKNTGAVSTLHMELNFQNGEFLVCTDLLTPNIAHFLGAVRIKELIEYVVCISSFLKLNQEFISKLLQIAKQEYSVKKHNEMRKSLRSLFDRLQSLDRTKVKELLQSSTDLTHLCSVNPVKIPWF